MNNLPSVVPYNAPQPSMNVVPVPSVNDLHKDLEMIAKQVLQKFGQDRLNQFIQQLSFAEKTAVTSLLELSKQASTSGGRKTRVSRKKN